MELQFSILDWLRYILGGMGGTKSNDSDCKPVGFSVSGGGGGVKDGGAAEIADIEDLDMMGGGGPMVGTNDTECVGGEDGGDGEAGCRGGRMFGS